MATVPFVYGARFIRDRKLDSAEFAVVMFPDGIGLRPVDLSGQPYPGQIGFLAGQSPIVFQVSSSIQDDGWIGPTVGRQLNVVLPRLRQPFKQCCHPSLGPLTRAEADHGCVQDALVVNHIEAVEP